jgi:hypothetical protein
LNQAECRQSTQQCDQSQKTNLSIGQTSDAVKRFAPLFRKEKRNDALEKQHQSQCNGPRTVHKQPASFLRGRGRPRPGALEILEELGIRIHNHQVVTVLEAGAIRFQAAVKLVELGILTECLRINL